MTDVKNTYIDAETKVLYIEDNHSNIQFMEDIFYEFLN